MTHSHAHDDTPVTAEAGAPDPTPTTERDPDPIGEFDYAEPLDWSDAALTTVDHTYFTDDQLDITADTQLAVTSIPDLNFELAAQPWELAVSALNISDPNTPLTPEDLVSHPKANDPEPRPNSADGRDDATTSSGGTKWDLHDELSLIALLQMDAASDALADLVGASRGHDDDLLADSEPDTHPDEETAKEELFHRFVVQDTETSIEFYADEGLWTITVVPGLIGGALLIAVRWDDQHSTADPLTVDPGRPGTAQAVEIHTHIPVSVHPLEVHLRPGRTT